MRRILCTAAIALSLLIPSALTAQELPANITAILDAIKSACLVSEKLDKAYALKVRAAIDVIEKSLAAEVEASEKYSKVYSQVSEIDAAANNQSLDSARKCIKDTGIFAILNVPPSKINIALVDGTNLSYQSDADMTGRSNLVVLTELLAGKIGDPDPIFHQIGVRVDWSDWEQIANKHPDLVLLHWSAFEKSKSDASGKQVNCEPMIDNRCGNKIVRMLSLIARHSGKPTKFIIYSRSKFMCAKQFKDGLMEIMAPYEQKLYENVFLFRIPKQNDGFDEADTTAALRDMVMWMFDRASFKMTPANLAGGEPVAEGCSVIPD